jgi:hypothetical protein
VSGLTSSIYVNVMHCDSSKDVWDKLKNVYEGDAKVKGVKIQTYRFQFEQLKTMEDEDIAAYFL